MTEPDALIGYTGFVGGNILHQHQFDAMYDATNIEQIHGKKFNLIVCAGAPGVKWLANKEPEKDMASIGRLMDDLAKVSCKKFVLISTIDVYPEPVLVNEDSVIVEDSLSPYGQHRRLLEKFVMNQFDYTIVRLPGVFGKGLKKNIIWDFMNQVHMPIHNDSIFQFYYLNHLFKDITVALNHNLSIINIATEPIPMNELKKEIFGPDFFPQENSKMQRYDMQTKHGSLWQGQNYLYSKQEVLSDLKAFIGHS